MYGDLIYILEQTLLKQTIFTEGSVFARQIKAHSVPVRVLGCDQRRATPNKWIEYQLALMREQLDYLTRQRYREGSRVNILVPDISLFVGELPDS